MEEIVLPREEHTNWLYNTKWTALKILRHQLAQPRNSLTDPEIYLLGDH